MKILRPLDSVRRASRAFTLAEIMIASTLFSFVVIGVVYINLYGLTMFNVALTKLSSTDTARKAVNQVRDQIREAKLIYIGNGNATSFVMLTNGVQQIGTAIQIYATTNTNTFLRYYLDTNANSLNCITNSLTTPTTLATSVTNRDVFEYLDCYGNILTNYNNNRVIRLKLEFYQLQYPIVRIGPGNYYTYYRLQTKVGRRAID